MAWTELLPGLPLSPFSLDIAVSNSATGNILYVAYTEKVNPASKRMVVKQWNAALNQWEPVGGTQVGIFNSPGPNCCAAIAVNSNGTPYVFYGNRLGQLLVKKLNGGIWTNLPPLPAMQGDNPSICFNINVPDHPYVAYMDALGGPLSAKVKKYDGTTWQSIDPLTPDESNISMAVSSGFPYLVSNYPPLWLAKVQHWNGLSWDTLGGPASQGETSMLHIGFDISKPYIVFQDLTMGQKATVMHYTNNSGWKELRDSTGLADFPHTTPDTPVSNISMAIDNTNKVILAIGDINNGSIVRVIQFNGTNWMNVGDPISFASSIAGTFRLIVDDHNVIYFANMNALGLNPVVWRFS